MVYIFFHFKIVHEGKKHVMSTGGLVHTGHMLTQQNSREELLQSSFFAVFQIQVLQKPCVLLYSSRSFHLYNFLFLTSFLSHYLTLATTVLSQTF